MDTSDKWLIWSIEHSAWWAPNRSGYKASWGAAGVYTKKEAFQISAKANWESLNEVPVPADFFEYQHRVHDLITKVKI